MEKRNSEDKNLPFAVSTVSREVMTAAYIGSEKDAFQPKSHLDKNKWVFKSRCVKTEMAAGSGSWSLI